MNTTNSSSASAALKCCTDYCKTIFAGSGGPVVNTYSCNQQSFTSALMWQIHQERKLPVISVPAPRN